MKTEKFNKRREFLDEQIIYMPDRIEKHLRY